MIVGMSQAADQYMSVSMTLKAFERQDANGKVFQADHAYAR